MPEPTSTGLLIEDPTTGLVYCLAPELALDDKTGMEKSTNTDLILFLGPNIECKHIIFLTYAVSHKELLISNCRACYIRGGRHLVRRL